MILSPVRKMAFKLAAYSVFVLYLIGDLYIWHGFLAEHFDAHFKPLPKRLGDGSQTVAFVYGEPITQSQLDRRVQELAWQKGDISSNDLNAWKSLDSHRLKTLKTMAINDLVNAALLRLKTRVVDLGLNDTSAEAGRIVEEMESRFDGDHEAFMNALVGMKMPPAQLRDRMAARLKQEQKLASMQKEVGKLTDDDLRGYYDQLKERMTIPEHRVVQHVFLASLDKDPNQLAAAAGEILNRANSGESLDELARKYSEDPRSAQSGGHLGFVYRDRDVLPGVDLWSLPKEKPVLVQSRVGWHVMILGPVVPARVPSFDEARESLRSALTSLRRERAADIYTDNIRKEGRFAGRVEIAPSVFK